MSLKTYIEETRQYIENDLSNDCSDPLDRDYKRSLLAQADELLEGYTVETLLDELERRIKLRIEESKELEEQALEREDVVSYEFHSGVTTGYQNVLQRDIDFLRTTIK